MVNTRTWKTQSFSTWRQISYKFENVWYFMHVLATCDIIQVGILLQRHYIFLLPIYKLVISNKILVSLHIPQVKCHSVTFLQTGVWSFIFWWLILLDSILIGTSFKDQQMNSLKNILSYYVWQEYIYLNSLAGKFIWLQPG